MTPMRGVDGPFDTGAPTRVLAIATQILQSLLLEPKSRVRRVKETRATSSLSPSLSPWLVLFGAAKAQTDHAASNHCPLCVPAATPVVVHR